MKTHFDFAKNRWNTDTKQYLSGHDVVFNTPVNDPSYGLPLGDGDTGALLYFEKNALNICLNKTDLWDTVPGESDYLTSDKAEMQTTLRHGAELSLEFAAPVFDRIYTEDFQARLSLYQACAEIRGKTPFSDVSINAFCSSETKTAFFDCSCRFSEKMPLSLVLKRWGSRTFGHHWEIYRDASVGLSGTQAAAEENALCLLQNLRGTAFCVYVKIFGKKAPLYRGVHSRECRAEFSDEYEYGFTFAVTVAAGETAEQAKETAVKNISFAEAKGRKRAFEEHCDAWADFWSRSCISIPDKFLENLWYLNFYYANSECRGKYPPHFCNGIWGFFHDYVPWVYYFNFNMQLQTFPVDAANHPELLNTYFDFRHGQLEKAKLYSRNLKHCKGAFYADVFDKDGKQDAATKDHNACGALLSLAMYRHYLFTGDGEFLKKKALPVMLETAEFYMDFLVKGEDGVYHIHRGQAYEGTPPMEDPVTDLAALKALFTCLAELFPEKNEYRDVRDRLAPFLLTEMDKDELKNGRFIHGLGKGKPARSRYVVAAGTHSDTKEILRKTHGNPNKERYYGVPCSEFAPLFPSGTVGLADQGTELFDALYNLMMMHPESVEPENDMTTPEPSELCMGWCLYPVFLARLGLKDELKKALRQSAGLWIKYPQGFGLYGPYNSFIQDTKHRWRTQRAAVLNGEKNETAEIPSWDYRHFDYEALPVLATAMNEMLLQSYGGTIRLFPAADTREEHSFTLAAEGGFLIHAEISADGYCVCIENRLGRAQCDVVLPADFGGPYCWDPDSGEDVSFEIVKKNKEPICRIDSEKHRRIAVASENLSDAEALSIPVPKKNAAAKSMGGARLGVDRMY